MELKIKKNSSNYDILYIISQNVKKARTFHRNKTKFSTNEKSGFATFLLLSIIMLYFVISTSDVSTPDKIFRISLWDNTS